MRTYLLWIPVLAWMVGCNDCSRGSSSRVPSTAPVASFPSGAADLTSAQHHARVVIGGAQAVGPSQTEAHRVAVQPASP